MGYFFYNEQQTELLSQRDDKLGAFISQKGIIKRKTADDIFSGLCYNIVNQQLSMKACNTLWSKLSSRLGNISPENCRSAEILKACGLSQNKSDCIAECARRFISCEITEQQLKQASDNEVTTLLTSIKGIGAWTAEMTLIFCLKRNDVLSLSDYGIRKGLSLLHGIDINNIKAMKPFKELYSPYGTIASFYLWEAAHDLDKGGKIC